MRSKGNVHGTHHGDRLESISEDRRKIVFVSEAIENIAPGWRAKEIYEISGDQAITETFELAPPDKGFELYSRTDLKRVK